MMPCVLFKMTKMTGTVKAKQWAKFTIMHILPCAPLLQRTRLQSFLNLRDLGPKLPFSSRIKSGIKGNFRRYESHNDRDNSRERAYWDQYHRIDISSPLNIDKALSHWVTRGWTFQVYFLTRKYIHQLGYNPIFLNIHLHTLNPYQLHDY